MIVMHLGKLETFLVLCFFVMTFLQETMWFQTQDDKTSTLVGWKQIKSLHGWMQSLLYMRLLHVITFYKKILFNGNNYTIMHFLSDEMQGLQGFVVANKHKKMIKQSIQCNKRVWFQTILPLFIVPMFQIHWR